MNNRRDFLKTLGLGAAGVTLVGRQLLVGSPKGVPSVKLPPIRALGSDSLPVDPPRIELPPVGMTYPTQDNLLPSMWAVSAQRLLEQNLVMGNLVHRDCSDEVSQFGDIINLRSPGCNIPIPLDQLFSTHFVIRDGDASKSFQELREQYLRPSIQKLARQIDQALIGQAVHYTDNTVGGQYSLYGANATNTIIDARRKLNDNRAPLSDRNLVLSTASSQALKCSEILPVIRDGGGYPPQITALEEARLGKYIGFTCWHVPDMPWHINLGFHPDTMALVTRPLPLALPRLPIRSGIGVHNNLALRVSMMYDVQTSGTRITTDVLAGIGVLDTNLGVIIEG